MLDSRIPRLHPQAAYQIVDGQAIVVLADSGQVTILNELGAFIWQLCDGEHTLDQIVAEIVDEYEVQPETAAQDASEFLDSMAEIRAIAFV